MPISQTTITGSVKTPANADAQITEISFKLSGSDFEGGELIAVNTVTGAVVTEDGDFTVTLWPNDKGMEGNTTYAVTMKFSDGSTLTHLKTLTVTHSAGPRTLEDVAFQSKLAATFKGYKVVLMKAAEYAALTTKAPNTIYAVKA